MIGLVVAVLIVVVLNLLVTLYMADRFQREIMDAIRRQDDRLRKRAERQVSEDDEEFIGQLVEDLRDGNTGLSPGTAESVAQTLLERHPGAKLPEDL